MAAPVFFPAPASLTLSELARLTGAEARMPSDRPISGIAALTAAGPGDVTFFENKRYLAALSATMAGACFVTERDAGLVPGGTVALITKRPHEAFAKAGAALYPAAMRPQAILATQGRSPGAEIHATARLEGSATIEARAVVGPGAEIGEGTRISAGAVIGPGVRIGRRCFIGPNAVITHALLGDGVVIHPGACIGQDGFGYIPGAAAHLKIVQIGRVIIQDNVEIGANTTIDRGSVRDTVIGEGSKIDNLVQIGHNVVVGRNCLIAGQVGISGSVTIGDSVMLGGQVGIRDNVTIGSGAVIAATSAVGTDVPANARWGGIPAHPVREWLRERETLRRLTSRAATGEGNEEKKEEPDE
jgi:UDP-3-O-[3-hydroxymyristoyl] glucosamine N-acyltransferase